MSAPCYTGMSDASQQPGQPPPRPQYRWPRYVLAAFLLAIVLAVIWLSFEIRRTQRIRQLNSSFQAPP